MLLAIGKWVIEFYAKSGQLPQSRDVQDHARIFDAVRRRDAGAARAAMRAHLEWVRDSLEQASGLGTAAPSMSALRTARRS